MPPETITVFFASNTTQLAYDHPDYSSSMFTYYLLKGLKVQQIMEQDGNGI